MKSMRQFEVLHTATGMLTLVNAPVYAGGGVWLEAGRRAGHRYPVDCIVNVVPRGQEIPLPFDEIPLVVRRPQW